MELVGTCDASLFIDEYELYLFSTGGYFDTGVVLFRKFLDSAAAAALVVHDDVVTFDDVVKLFWLLSLYFDVDDDDDDVDDAKNDCLASFVELIPFTVFDVLLNGYLFEVDDWNALLFNAFASVTKYLLSFEFMFFFFFLRSQSNFFYRFNVAH